MSAINPSLCLLSGIKTGSMFVLVWIVIEGRASPLMLLSYIASNTVSCSESQNHIQLRLATNIWLLAIAGIRKQFSLLDRFMHFRAFHFFWSVSSLYSLLSQHYCSKVSQLSHLNKGKVWKPLVLLMIILVSIQHRPACFWEIPILWYLMQHQTWERRHASLWTPSPVFLS